MNRATTWEIFPVTNPPSGISSNFYPYVVNVLGWHIPRYANYNTYGTIITVSGTFIFLPFFTKVMSPFHASFDKRKLLCLYLRFFVFLML